MSSDNRAAHPAIRIEQVSKRYDLGAPQERYRTLREDVARQATRLARRLRHPLAATSSTRHQVWALDGVSLTVPQGRAVGIIGRNGSGKSTLLKILSRVTPPTSGRVEVRGKVGTLLEVGTGFHPELTGRENVFLSGAILGMRRAEIACRFDEIVEFADVRRFVDTPVKRYSSGMYLRLAFAVAAHLEPQILLVDEVLAVGDAAFQRKCLGRMGDVAGQGRTVLFVSHDVDAVQRLCSECVLLDGGRIVAHGPTAHVVEQYLSQVHGDTVSSDWIDLRARPRRGTGEARFVAARVAAAEGVGGRPYPGGPLDIALQIDSDAARTVGSMAVSVETLSGAKLIEADILTAGQVVSLVEGTNTVHFRISELHLNPGLYSIRLWLGHTATSGFDHLHSAFQIEVVRRRALTADAPATGGAVPCRFDVVQE